MTYTLFAGLVSLIAGLMLLFFPNAMAKTGDALNRVVVNLDEKVSRIRLVMGILLLLAGGLILWQALPLDGQAWYMFVIAVLALFFGLLFLVFPNGLAALSKIFDKMLISTDSLLLTTGRKIAGIILIILAIYQLITVYFMMM
ncbi:MAG: hypothetical protein ABIJ26_05540 [Candidatus Margulisiibacteriota bacterium]|nr:hypothetical protein [Candidatus Margulisiibacteriota bacterium]